MKLAPLFLAAVFVALSARVVAGAIDFFDLPGKIVVPKSLDATLPPAVPALVADRRATPTATPAPAVAPDFFKTPNGSLDAPEKARDEVRPAKVVRDWERGSKGHNYKRWKK